MSRSSKPICFNQRATNETFQCFDLFHRDQVFSRFYNCFIFVLYLFAGNELVANENFYQNDLFFSTSIEEERLRSYFFFLDGRQVEPYSKVGL